ncbi:hypothetical protein EYF80_027146 [Liparis tanakae]|uniref:Uncharacterized protein n=1 Tax=Liparis tanakae TaxID=230148 RepID=A0A4Z2H9R8_9TELE|nr:hypothetical protein EYF80_027146 [Liparis tanakae]
METSTIHQADEGREEEWVEWAESQQWVESQHGSGVVFNVYFSVVKFWLSSHIWLFRLVSSQLIDASCRQRAWQRQQASFSRGMSFCLYASRSGANKKSPLLARGVAFGCWNARQWALAKRVLGIRCYGNLPFRPPFVAVDRRIKEMVGHFNAVKHPQDTNNHSYCIEEVSSLYKRTVSDLLHRTWATVAECSRSGYCCNPSNHSYHAIEDSVLTLSPLTGRTVSDLFHMTRATVAECSRSSYC